MTDARQHILHKAHARKCRKVYHALAQARRQYPIMPRIEPLSHPAPLIPLYPK